MVAPSTLYPVRFSVDYPDGPRDRVAGFFRVIAAIPIIILWAMLSGGSWDPSGYTAGFVGGPLVFAPALMVLFRKKYPRWWFEWNVGLLRFENRVAAFLFLLRDEYPATDEDQAVHLDIDYPAAERDLNRWLPLLKWILAIPHYFVLAFLSVGLLLVVVVAWFAILFVGRHPRSLFNYVVATMRWYNRVWAYAFLMVTDRYPPFSFAG